MAQRVPGRARNKGEEIPPPRVGMLAVGASGTHNAEWFYLRALRSIWARSDVLVSV